MWAAVACAASAFATTRAGAEALLLVEVESGKVLHAENATYPWYPASITKIMTAYVTLARGQGRPDHPRHAVVGLANAAAQNPVKMGFPTGTRDRRQRAQDADGEVGERHRGRAGRRRRRLDRELRRSDELQCAPARHDAIELRQSERAAGRRADHLGARHGHPGARAHPRDFRNTTTTGTCPASAWARWCSATTTR